MKFGYEIESRIPNTGKLRFIKVKSRMASSDSITVTGNQVLTALNKPEDLIPAIGAFQDGGGGEVRYVRKPFGREPDFGAVSVNYKLLVSEKGHYFVFPPCAMRIAHIALPLG